VQKFTEKSIYSKGEGRFYRHF